VTDQPKPPAAGGDAALAQLLAEIRACTRCAAVLPLGPRPVLRGRAEARLLIISQAPGRRAHLSGLSFDDQSGERLRGWLGLGREIFYDESRVAVMPVGFCYPGSDARGGDRPPRPECAPLWHQRLRARLPAIELCLLVGRHAIGYYLPQTRAQPLTRSLARWRDFLPGFFVLPHPSWHVGRWLADNRWFERDVIPELRARVAAIVSPANPRSAPCPRR
jgi:uracil-DNA glycosylase